jgi:hypothetical protein
VCVRFFNAIKKIVTDMEGNIRIGRLLLPLAHAISFTLANTMTLGQSVYPNISLHINNNYKYYLVSVMKVH